MRAGEERLLKDQGEGAGAGGLAVPGEAAAPCRHCWYSGLPGTLSAPQLQSCTCAGLPSESQKSLAGADGAAHMTPAVKAAARPPTVVINTLAFTLDSFTPEADGTLLRRVALAG